MKRITHLHLGRRGFTLVELLIVIAIIAILAAVTFVALDPLTRFQDSRNARRWSDVTSILSAIRVDQVDNGGQYQDNIAALTPGTNYMVGTDSGAACDPTTAGVTCAVAIADTNCVDLEDADASDVGAGEGLVEGGYLWAMPVSPNGVDSWTTGQTGYYLVVNANNSVTIGACDAEGGATISVTR
jgi:prepilin-type N-terminal cleavage/methylation domain-containing protein